MIHSIENDKIKLQISEIGAEMQSLILKSNGKEYLWQGVEPYWNGRAYNLFPICGRLTDGKYTYKGKEYSMCSHGFVRNTKMTAEKISDEEIVFTLVPDEVIKAQYPFDFVYTVRYVLSGETVKTVYGVENKGSEPMYFAVGGHPGFNVPLNEGEEYTDYYLEFACEKDMKHLVFTPLYDTGRTESYPLKDGKIIELYHSMFDNDGIFFTDMCGRVTLKNKKGDNFVCVSYPEMRNLGIWHTTGSDAPFICIEPWDSVPAFDGVVDDLETKKQMQRLDCGKKYENSFDITIG